jgi:predicted DsbA family dithiol-disulfide isomerase
LKKEYYIHFRWRAFPLRPHVPEEGLALREVIPDPQVDLKAMAEKMTGIASGLGLPFRNPENMYNTRLAQELGVWASTMNKGDEYHHAVYTAYFAEGKNISDRQILGDLVETIGLSIKKAMQCLENREFKSRVDEDWQLSKKMDIVAAPTYLLNGSRLVGAHPYEKLKQFLETHDIKRRNDDS